MSGLDGTLPPHAPGMRIGLFGGSFNPPHMAHQMTCLYLLQALGAARVRLVPVFRHPFGKDLAPYEHRVAMCHALAAPFGRQVLVDEIESEPGMSGRSIDTLERMQKQRPQEPLAFVIGADILADACARLGANVDRYSFIVVDSHHLLLAGLPAHYVICET